MSCEHGCCVCLPFISGGIVSIIQSTLLHSKITWVSSLWFPLYRDVSLPRKICQLPKSNFMPLSISVYTFSLFTQISPSLSQMIQVVSLVPGSLQNIHHPLFREMHDKEALPTQATSTLFLENLPGLNSQPLGYLNLSLTYLLCL